MEPSLVRTLPGHEIVVPGLADLASGVESDAALTVALAAARLRAVGLDVPAVVGDQPAHPLYLRLAHEHGDDAHGRYLAFVNRIVSFARAAEHASAR